MSKNLVNGVPASQTVAVSSRSIAMVLATLAAGCTTSQVDVNAPAPLLPATLLPATLSPAAFAGPRFAQISSAEDERHDAASPSDTPHALTSEPAESRAAGAADHFLLIDDPPRCPTLTLGTVCVDRWESSLIQMLPGGVERPWSPFEALKGHAGLLRAQSKKGVKPQGYISGVDAQRACNVAGKRLCTAREWVAACRGPQRTMYPYGSLRRKKACNDDSRAEHPVAEVTKRLGLPVDQMWYESMGHPMINQLENTLRTAGERAECTNEYGAYDMVGNLHEWIEDLSGTFRGGFYMDTIVNGEGCNYATTAHSFKYHDYSTGFRCCMDADAVE